MVVCSTSTHQLATLTHEILPSLLLFLIGGRVFFIGSPLPRLQCCNAVPKKTCLACVAVERCEQKITSQLKRPRVRPFRPMKNNENPSMMQITSCIMHETVATTKYVLPFSEGAMIPLGFMWCCEVYGAMIDALPQFVQ